MIFALAFVYFTIFTCTIHAELFIPINTNARFILNFTSADGDFCKNNVGLLMTSLQNHTLWAYRLWDATAKSSIGLTEGSTYQLGYFDECLSIEEPFAAKYCLTKVQYEIIPNDTIQDPYSLEYKPYESVYNKLYYTNDPNRVRRDQVYWGLCVPAACSPNDIRNALQEYLDEQHNPYIAKYDVKINYDDCYVKENEFGFTIADYSFGLLVFSLITMVAIGTAFDLKYYTGTANADLKNKKSVKLLMCFSAKANFASLSKPDSSNKALNVLYGCKYFMTFGIVVGHSIVNSLVGPVFNFEVIEQVNRTLIAMSVCRGEVIVDLFFTVSGLLATYSYLVQSEKRRVNPIRQAILRYSRTAPMLLIITYFYVTVLDKTGSGPLWNRVIGAEKKYCENNWWINMLLLSNYIDINNLCVAQGWYLSADFHMFVLSIPLNMLIKRNNKLCWIMFSTVLSIFLLTPVLIQYLGDKDPVIFIFNDFFSRIRKNDNFQTMYVPTHTRFATYIIGMIFGFVYYQLRDSKFKLSTIWCVIISSAAVIVQCACIMGAVVFYNPYLPNDVVSSSLYVALHRPAFVTASVILFLTFSYGTVPYFAKFLSWSPFIPLAKLSFGTYMVHMIFQLTKAGSLKAPQTFTIYNWLTTAVLEVILSHFVALILYILVENPFSKTMKELIPSDCCDNRITSIKSESKEDVISNP